jgi:hypothetical protein
MSGAAELVLLGVVKWVPLSVRTVWDLVRDGGDQVAQEVFRGAARHLLVYLDEGELRRSVVGDEEGELALRSSNLGDVDMKVADRRP